MKKFAKVLPIIIIVAVIGLIFCSTAFAAVTDPTQFSGNPSANTQGIENVGNYIITIVTVIGTVASVIVLIVLGLKYMMGSAEEKAEYKKTLLPYVIGALLVFAASAIAGFVYQAASSVKNS